MEDAISPGRHTPRVSFTWRKSAAFAFAAGVWIAAAGGCSNHIGTTAASYLRRVREDPDPNLRYLAYSKLAEDRCYDTPEQKREAVGTLIDKFEHAKEPLASRAAIIRTLGELRDPAARELVVKAVSDPEPTIRVEACRALGKVGKTEDATILTRVMTVDTLEDARIAAIDALGELKASDPRINRVLVDGMQHEDPATRLASLAALRRITGKDLGVDATAWEKYLGPAAAPVVGVASDMAIVAAPTTNEPSYPPRPLSTAAGDAETEQASFPPRKRATPTVPMTSSDPSYPGRNPNLPPPQ